MPSNWNRISGYSSRKIIERREGFVVVERSVAGKRAMDGKTIVFFSDLHWSCSGKIGEELSGAINALEPAWIVFSGDLVSHVCHLESALSFLASLKAVSGKINVLGNWDLKRRRWLPSSVFRGMIESTGFKTLSYDTFAADGMFFAGLGKEPTGAASLSGRLQSRRDQDFCCVVTHSPDYAVDNLDVQVLRHVDLILCGHTHGGQMRLPLFGALRTSSKHWKRFEYGEYIHKEAGTRMVVTCGVGCTALPVRLFCEPEIVLLRINAAAREF